MSRAALPAMIDRHVARGRRYLSLPATRHSLVEGEQCRFPFPFPPRNVTSMVIGPLGKPRSTRHPVCRETDGQLSDAAVAVASTYPLREGLMPGGPRPASIIDRLYANHITHAGDPHWKSCSEMYRPMRVNFTGTMRICNWGLNDAKIRSRCLTHQFPDLRRGLLACRPAP